MHHQRKFFQYLQHPPQPQKPLQLSPTTVPRSKPLKKPLQPLLDNVQQQPKRPIVKQQQTDREGVLITHPRLPNSNPNPHSGLPNYNPMRKISAYKCTHKQSAVSNVQQTQRVIANVQQTQREMDNVQQTKRAIANVQQSQRAIANVQHTKREISQLKRSI